MKAKERHKLKSNELVDYIREISEFLNKHGSRILIGAVVVIIAVGGGLWFFKSQARAKAARAGQLQNLIVLTDLQQTNAAQQARDPMNTTLYDMKAVVGALGEIVQKETGTPLGRMALLQQAEALRSELYFSNAEMTEEERLRICDSVEQIYQQIISSFPQENHLVAPAHMGLALLNEERGQWDQARQLYQEIVEDTDGTFAGTIFPDQARKRLLVLEEVDTLIEFPPAPPPEIEEIPVEDVVTIPGMEGVTAPAPGETVPPTMVPEQPESEEKSTAPTKEEGQPAEPKKQDQPTESKEQDQPVESKEQDQPAEDNQSKPSAVEDKAVEDKEETSPEKEEPAPAGDQDKPAPEKETTSQTNEEETKNK